MRALVIADRSSTELLYFWLDNAFKRRLLSDIAGEECDNLSSSLNSLVLSHFAPLITCYETLKSQFNESCSLVQCEDDKCTIMFKQYQQWLYIGVYDIQLQYKEKIRREMGFLCASIGFLFGPCGHFQFKTPSVDHRQKVWRKVTCLIESYAKLCSSESSFLLEAIERLQVNDSVLKPCRNLIKECFNSIINRKASRSVVYVMMFVGTKLLTFHSDVGIASDLNTSNILQILALLHSNFSSFNEIVSSNNKCNEERESVVNSANFSSDFASSHLDNPDDDTMFLRTDLDFLYDNTEYFSDVSASIITETQSHDSLIDSSSCGSYAASTVFNEQSDVDEEDTESMIIDENYFSSSEEPEPYFQEDCYEVSLYLSNIKSPFVPHVLHCIPISSQIKMVLVSQVNNAVISDVICAMLYWLKKLEEGHSRSIAVQKLKNCNRRLSSFVSKLNNETRKKVKAVTKTLQEISSGMEFINMWINKLEKQLHVLFKFLFPSCVDKMPESPSLNLTKVQSYVTKKLLEYTDYLTVRAQQNTPITSYLNRLSGMVHFAFLHRMRFGAYSITQPPSKTFEDQIFMTSIAALNPGINTSPALLLSSSLKQEFWHTCYLACESMVNGENYFMRETKDFIFTFFTWVGNEFKPIHLYENQSNSLTTSQKHKSPSIFAGEFYRECISSSDEDTDDIPFLHQIICVHFAVVPHEVIRAQIEQLYLLLRKSF